MLYKHWPAYALTLLLAFSVHRAVAAMAFRLHAERHRTGRCMPNPRTLPSIAISIGNLAGTGCAKGGLSD